MAEEGRSQGWLYALGITGGGIFYFVVGIIFYLVSVILLIKGWPEFDDLGHLKNVDPIIEYISLNLSIMPLLIAVLFGVKVLHNRPVLSLVSPQKKIRWSRIAFGFLLWLGLGLTAFGIDYLIRPKTYEWTFEASSYFLYLPLVLIMTPLQTTAEELYFRGWILQATAKISENIWFLSILNGALFFLPHMWNPEMASNPYLVGLLYFGIGAFLSVITVKTKGLEYALGIHAANNLMALIVSLDGGVLTVPSLFKYKEMIPVADLVAFTASALIAGFLILRREKRTATQ